MTRVYTAGQGFAFKGGYGGLAGVTPGVSSVAEVEPAVAAQAADVDVEPRRHPAHDVADGRWQRRT